MNCTDNNNDDVIKISSILENKTRMFLIIKFTAEGNKIVHVVQLSRVPLLVDMGRNLTRYNLSSGLNLGSLSHHCDVNLATLHFPHPGFNLMAVM